MVRTLALPLVLAAAALHASPGLAQDQFPLRASHNGAFERAYPEASRLLDAVVAGRLQVLDRLAADASDARVETQLHDQLVQQVERGRAGSPSTSNLQRTAPQALEVFQRAHQLQRHVLDIYADARVADKYAAVDQAVDAYLARPGVALPAEPKLFDVANTALPMPAMDEHAGHGGGTMDHAMGFENLFPKVNGLLWSQHWLENALFEPLIRYQTEAEKRAGVQDVVGRFRAMFADAPNNYPTQMPTTAAIAPDLTMHHPRAAVILNSLHLLEDAVANLLTDHMVTDRTSAIRETVQAFADPAVLAITDYEWLLISLRPGIFYQGGPAIGSMDRSERNAGTPHSRHLNPVGNRGGMSNMTMPGMGGRGGAGGAMQGSGGPESSTPAPEPDHSNH